MYGPAHELDQVAIWPFFPAADCGDTAGGPAAARAGSGSAGHRLGGAADLTPASDVEQHLQRFLQHQVGRII